MSIFAELQSGVTAHSADETRGVARRLAAELPAGSTVALHGDLGVGKTTFVQGLAQGLGIQDSVTSPTFNIFTLHRGSGRTLVHLDAYRLENARQVEDLMLEDFLVPPCWFAVEWPERIAEWLPAETIHLRLSIQAPGVHRIARV